MGQLANTCIALTRSFVPRIILNLESKKRLLTGHQVALLGMSDMHVSRLPFGLLFLRAVSMAQLGLALKQPQFHVA